MSSQGLERTLSWLRGMSILPVDESWVPGADLDERRALAALASVAAHLGAASIDGAPPQIREWLSTAVAVPEDVSHELKLALVERPDEALAALYADLVTGRNRRVLGTFFTPAAEVRLMLDRWVANEESPTQIIDVGAGVGVFTAASAEQWPDADVVAVDVNPVTLGLLAARATASEEPALSKGLKLVLSDFTTWLPEQPSGSDSRRLILGNPPYTRWQLLPRELRTRLAVDVAELCGSRSSLATFITAMSIQYLNPNDGLCLLLPAHWLESDYAKRLRRHLLQLTDRRVELWLVKSGMFKDATVDAVVLMVGTRRTDVQPLTVAEWPGGAPKEINRSQETGAGWRTWFELAETASLGRVRLGDLATVRRGVATGANKFFVLSDRDVRKLGLPPSCIRPVVQRLRAYRDGVDRESFDAMGDEESKWLFSAKRRKNQAATIKSYVREGVVNGVDRRHLCAARPVWHDLDHDVRISDVVITAMTRDRFHVAPNHLGAAITNNLYGWTWSEAVSSKQRESVVSWLKSDDGQLALKSIARRQGNELLKLEPRSLRELVLPPHIA